MPEITSDPKILGGKPRIEGTRVSVLAVIDLLDAGMTTQEVAKQLDITTSDVQTARQYARQEKEEIELLRKKREQIHKQLRDRSRAPSR